MADNRPIGIFDSGIGGLTVAKAIRKKLPNEPIVYFGDTAHVPYGDKSSESIKLYSREISRFLVERNCKMVVVACNTASAKGFSEVEKICGPTIPAVNVIDPVVDHIKQHFPKGKIGVIGTKGTIRSRVYPRRIHKAAPTAEVTTKATPLLAPMIEEGFFNNNISKAVIGSYLNHSTFRSLDALVLGCTHYPLIEKEVQEILGPNVKLVDSASVVADVVADQLKALHLHNEQPGADQFFVSDYTDAFRASTRLFFGEQITLQTSRIWDAS